MTAYGILEKPWIFLNMNSALLLTSPAAAAHIPLQPRAGLPPMYRQGLAYQKKRNEARVRRNHCYSHSNHSYVGSE